MNSVWVLLRPTGFCEQWTIVRQGLWFKDLIREDFKPQHFLLSYLRHWLFVQLESNSHPPTWQALCSTNSTTGAWSNCSSTTCSGTAAILFPQIIIIKGSAAPVPRLSNFCKACLCPHLVIQLFIHLLCWIQFNYQYLQHSALLISHTGKTLFCK